MSALYGAFCAEREAVTTLLHAADQNPAIMQAWPGRILP